MTAETRRMVQIGTHSVAKWPARFTQWGGMPLTNTYGGKAVIDWQGEPVFAELAIVRMLQSEGFDAVWIDGYGNRFRSSISEERVLPEHAKALLKTIIQSNNGKRQGCWDVLAWKGETYMFVESKRRGKDRIRGSQIQWLDAAIQAGMDVSCFRVCEWDLAEVAPDTHNLA